jgi:hypothetical protein
MMSSNSSESTGVDIFMGGFLVGIFACLIIFFLTMSGETTIQSSKPIIPEKKLTTDGKTVDTLYIYKQ